MSISNMLIGLAISSLIMTSALYGFQTVQRFYSKQKIAVETLDNKQTTLQFLSRDIQGCGYRGCRSRDPNFPLRFGFKNTNPAHRYFRFDRPSFAFKVNDVKMGTCTKHLPPVACQRIKENSAVLILYNVPKTLTKLKNPMKDPSSDISLNPNADIWNGSLVLVSDCQQADVFIASLVTHQILQHETHVDLNESNALSKAYGIDAEVGELQTVAYYIGTLEREAKGKHKNKPRFALFRDDFIHHADELIPGISDLSLQFGLRSLNDASVVYKSLDNMLEDDWTNVVMLKIWFESDQNQKWSHEIALRNGYGINLGSHSFGLRLVLGASCFASSACNDNSCFPHPKASFL